MNRPVPKDHPGHPGDTAPVGTVRPLTTQERSFIQTFPPDFKWPGTKTNLEQMIGNAVPVELGRYVAQCVRDYQQDEQAGSVLTVAKRPAPTLAPAEGQQLRLLLEPAAAYTASVC